MFPAGTAPGTTRKTAAICCNLAAASCNSASMQGMHEGCQARLHSSYSCLCMPAVGLRSEALLRLQEPPPSSLLCGAYFFFLLPWTATPAVVTPPTLACRFSQADSLKGSLGCLFSQ